jgi:choline dehydrogenase-like flavoprotein
MSILIIGSGVVGSTVAKKLLGAGKGPVTMLEAGPDIPMADAANWYNVVTCGSPPYTECYDKEGDFTSSGIDLWNINGGRVLGRGGSTLVFGGWLPRFKPEDFHYKTNTCKGLDWPFGYDELEPYYCKAEQLLGVSGDSSDQDPLRSKPYVFDAAPYPLLMGPIIEAMQKLNMTYTHMPVSRYGKEFNNQSKCLTTGTCKYCPVGGRYNGNQSLDDLADKEQFKLILNAPVTKILISSKNRVSGVEYLDTTTTMRHKIKADTIFVCAGAFETPKLLLNSKSDEWPNGLGNTHDLVGRYLMASPYFYANASLNTNPQKMEAELGFPSLCSRYYDTQEYQRVGKFFFNADYALPHFDIAKFMAKGQTLTEIQKAAKGAMRFTLQGTMAAIPEYENRVTPGHSTTRFGLPTTLIDTPLPIYNENQSKIYIKKMEDILLHMGGTLTGSGGYPQRGDHAMGTCRMAPNEKEGVVGSDLRVFGTDNLFIMGHAVFPSMGPANPTLTLVALTLKAMDTFNNWK